MRRGRWFLSVLGGATLSALLLGHGVKADSEMPEGFSVHLRPWYNFVHLEGPIIRGQSAYEFRRALRGNEIHLLSLSSVGGSLEEAILIAEMVYDLGLETYVHDDEICASACAIIFFAGKQRLLLGHLGVHQFLSTDGQGTDIGAQSVVAELLDLITKYDVRIEVLRQMMATPPDEMFWYGPESAAAFRRPSP